MKCKVCGGTGVIQGQAPGLVSCCPACDGKGFIELTNEEWFCNLSTEEKATFLAKNKMLNFDYQMWIEWLKEKHNGR